MKGALSEFEAAGLVTSVPLHRALMADPGFEAGGFDIHHLERLIDQGRLGDRSSS